MRCRSLNPFRAGRCLSTRVVFQGRLHNHVSIPFEQGDVFRPMIRSVATGVAAVSIPFEQGDVFRQLREHH